ncbi:MAG TPA: VOC family protein [Chitinophagaceae bacterium]|jgi:lactoylglutathione lyase|nr:VOC family protein [Chitinophagaceae bacterium]
MKPLKATGLLLILLAFAASARGQQKTVLNHIAHYVQDLKRSTDFYQHLIGLDTIPEPFHDGRHTWFSVGGAAHLHLISGAASVTAHDKNSHLCFSVPDMNVFIDRLKKAGIPYEDWPGKPAAVTRRVDGVQQIYFRDPDGYWVEINDDHPGRK